MAGRSPRPQPTQLSNSPIAAISIFLPPFGPCFDAQLPLGGNRRADPLDDARGGIKGTSIMLQPQHSDHQEHKNVDPLHCCLENLGGHVTTYNICSYSHGGFVLLLKILARSLQLIYYDDHFSDGDLGVFIVGLWEDGVERLWDHTLLVTYIGSSSVVIDFC